MTADDPLATDALSWREQAVARSLGSARLRAENRVQRFLDAALELMEESPTGRDFTVQEVVERSGQSLRSFYQYFGGKHELLLALFEDAVRSTAAHLRERIEREDGPLARLRCFVVEYHHLCRPMRDGEDTSLRPTPAMADFAQQLLTDHPTEAVRAHRPLVVLLEELLDDAAAAGVAREGLRLDDVAGIILQSIMFNVFSATIAGTPLRPDDADPAEVLWDLLFRGLAADGRR
ncbi:MAG TPA: TetR/AcrR family transcriptional regulator [Acidimicrobiales bacterium]